MAQLKLRSGFGSRTVISEGPSKWPEQPSKYGGAQAARDLLDAMGVHRSADGGKRGTSQLNASASGEYGSLELRPGVRFGEGTEQKRTEPMLLIRKGTRSLTLAQKKKKGRSRGRSCPPPPAMR